MMNANEKQRSKKHNGIISFWKFCFCMMVIIYHANVLATHNESILFTKGSIAVEFFFLVSGFLMAKTALTKKDDEDSENLGKETFHFIMKKVKVFLPYALFAGILGLIMQNIYEKMNIYDNVSSIWDLFLLRMTGLKGNVINGPIWYISAMLLCMMILYPLLRKYKNNFIYLIAPLIILFGFGWLNQNYTSLRVPDMWIGFTYKGVIRAFIELTLGSTLYVICQKFQNINFTKFGSFVITIIEILGFLLPFFISQFVAKATKYDFIVVAILSISITLAFSEKTIELRLFNNKFFFWLEKLSLPLYLCHFAVRIFMRNSSLFSSMTYYSKLSIFLLLTFIVSLICMYLLEFLKSKNYFKDKFKKLIIAE